MFTESSIARSSLVLLALVLGVPAEAAPDPVSSPDTVRLVLRPESRLWLEGDSNLHGWSCEANALRPEIQLDRGAGVQAPTSVEKAVVTVPVGDIECGNGKMNDNLRKALRMQDHPDIRFQVTEARFVDTGTQGLVAVWAKGDLTVAGATRPLELQVNGTDTGDGALRLQGRVRILMTDYGVEPPTALLGVLRTANPVDIIFDLVAGYAEVEARLGGR